MTKEKTPKPPARHLTPADKAAAERLSALWRSATAKRKAEGDPLTQQRMADVLAQFTGRGSQGAISQYLRGDIALNYKAVLAFASELGCAPDDIRGDLPEQRAAKHQADDKRPAGLIKSQTDNDIDALSYVVSALFAQIAAERPAEGARLAEAMRQQIPIEFSSNGLGRKLIAILEKGARKARIAPPSSSA
jgi:transcriptional regulator with XRE-family HTH domain